jgi:hypothetical protein
LSVLKGFRVLAGGAGLIAGLPTWGVAPAEAPWMEGGGHRIWVARHRRGCSSTVT